MKKTILLLAIMLTTSSAFAISFTTPVCKIKSDNPNNMFSIVKQAGLWIEELNSQTFYPAYGNTVLEGSNLVEAVKRILHLRQLGLCRKSRKIFRDKCVLDGNRITIGNYFAADWPAEVVALKYIEALKLAKLCK